MTTIREKIWKAVEAARLDRRINPGAYYGTVIDYDLVAAADIAEAEAARLEAAIDFLAKDVSSLTEEKDRLEVLLAESGKVNFHLASWQCQFTDGKKGLVNADNGDQYRAMEREVQRLEARVRELEKACAMSHDALGWITEDMDLIGDDKELVHTARAEAERVLGG